MPTGDRNNQSARSVGDSWLAEPYDLDVRECYVYFVAESCGPVKIGYAERPHDRLRSLQVGNPRKLYLLSYVAAPREIERRLHRRLSEHRITGEWYAPEPEVFAALDACERVFGDEHRATCHACHVERIEAERPDLRTSWEAHTCGEWRRYESRHTGEAAQATEGKGS